MKVNVFETSASGKNLEQVSAFEKTENHSSISVNTEVKRQEIIGFGVLLQNLQLQLEPAESRKSHGGTASLFF